MRGNRSVVVGGFLLVFVIFCLPGNARAGLKVFKQLSYLQFIFTGQEAEDFYHFAFERKYNRNHLYRTKVAEESSGPAVEYHEGAKADVLIRSRIDFDNMSSHVSCFVKAPWGESLENLHCSVQIPFDAFYRSQFRFAKDGDRKPPSVFTDLGIDVMKVEGKKYHNVLTPYLTFFEAQADPYPRFSLTFSMGCSENTQCMADNVMSLEFWRDDQIKMNVIFSEDEEICWND
ncbi:MAG: hypothetical protein KDD52_06545 [Bdellovibrionales bacterium]|nr:hypothetical protein [Bdellovibrionales bacterium]